MRFWKKWTLIKNKIKLLRLDSKFINRPEVCQVIEKGKIVIYSITIDEKDSFQAFNTLEGYQISFFVTEEVLVILYIDPKNEANPVDPKGY